MTAVQPDKKKHKVTTWAWAVVGALVSGAFALSQLTGAGVADRRTFDPLRVSAIEPVPDRVLGVVGPAAYNGADVTTTSHKCNSEHKAIESHSVKAWQTVTPGQGFDGFTVSNDNGLQTYPPGCHDFTYHNPMPDGAIARNEALFAQGRKSVWWQITATETPQPGGKVQTWVSDLFQVLPG